MRRAALGLLVPLALLGGVPALGASRSRPAGTRAGSQAAVPPVAAPSMEPARADREDWSARAAVGELVRLSESGDHEAAARKARELLGLVELRERWRSDEEGFREELGKTLSASTPAEGGTAAAGEAGEAEAASGTDALLAGLERTFAGYDDSLSAEIHYAVGVALLRASDALDLSVGDETDSAFRVAAAQAGPGELRLDALYDAGMVHLLEGERRRAEIPELGGSPPAPPTPGLPGAAPGAPNASGAGGAEPPDPLQLARAAYERAREALLLRLRADWKDGDTRANLELIQRRLHELDEIEKQREEEQSDQPPKSDDQEPSPDEDSKDSEQQQDSDDSKQQEGKDPQGSDSGQEGDQPDGDQKKKQDEEQEGQEPEPSDQGEEKPSDGSEARPDENAKQDEQHLTHEEIVRLLDQLNAIEAEAQDLKDALRKGRRIHVEKDW